jgi:hypothetical protein
VDGGGIVDFALLAAADAFFVVVVAVAVRDKDLDRRRSRVSMRASLPLADAAAPVPPFRAADEEADRGKYRFWNFSRSGDDTVDPCAR